MVKTVRLGKRRSFGRGLLLTILTFGLYAIYWWYKAPHEVYRQFELEDEGRDEGVVWLVLGLVVPFVVLVYFWKAVSNVAYVRARLRLKPGVSPLAFVSLFVAPNAGVVLLYLILLAAAPALPAEGTAEPDLEGPLGAILAAIVGVILVGIVLVVVAFHLLQRDVNEVWDAWERRVRELAAPPPPPGEPRPDAPASFEP